MAKYDYAVVALPDIEMYGGDTTPWVVRLMTSASQHYTGDPTNVSCVLTITVPKLTTTLGHTPSASSPVITKNGTVASDTEGVYATFEFARSETIGLRGKFIYQIEVTIGNQVRVQQGSLYVRQNNAT